MEGQLETEIQSPPLPKKSVHLPTVVDLPLGASCDSNISVSLYKSTVLCASPSQWARHFFCSRRNMLDEHTKCFLKWFYGWNWILVSIIAAGVGDQWTAPVTESATNAAILWLNSSRLKSFYTCVVCPRIQYINLRAQIRMYDAENVVALLNTHDDELTLGHLVETRK